MLANPAPVVNDQFASSVAADGVLTAIGTPLDDSPQADKGSVYVYERTVVTPSLATQASASVALGGTVSDTATLSGGNAPTGSITFKLYGPDDAACGGAAVFSSTVPVNGNGDYNSGNFTRTAVGTYRWIASYSGDIDNDAVSGACNDPNESVVVTAAATPTPTPTPTATPTATLSPTATPPATPTPSPSPTASPSPSPSATPSPSPTPDNAKTLNISTRADVGTAERVLIAGTIITGEAPKKVIIRAVGPSLAKAQVANALADTVLELYGSNGSLITSNDNWKDTQQAQIQQSGVPPEDDRESAIVITLQPGSYTAVVRGKDNTTGIALVEVYDLDSAAASILANISTRAHVQLDQNVLIGGFILSAGNASSDVILRAIGPSLAEQGISDALQDPTLELRNSDGDLVEANDDWKENPADAATVTAAGVPPRNDKESAIAASLPPGNYTVIVAGKAREIGVGLVEIYNLR